MSRSVTFRAMVCAVMVMFLAGNVFAEAAAMLEPNGTVMVNNAAVSRVSTVFSGDHVKTGTDSGAMVSGRGATVLLAANSSLTVGSRTMALDEGGAAITLAAGQSAQVGELSLTAAGDKPASYDVQRGCGYVKITVKSGSVTVTDGGKTTTLNAGDSRNFQVPKNGADCSAGAVNNKPGIITGVIVAVAAGLIVWFTTGESSEFVP